LKTSLLIRLAQSLTVLITVAAASAMPNSAEAEVNQVRISRGYGAHYLPLYVMEAQKLLEKHAKEAGAGDISVEYKLVDGGNQINDAMLAGALDIASTGTGGYLTLWAKAKGSPQLEVIGLGASASGGMILTTRNPNIKTLKDFTEKDRIAVPGIKTSLGAILLHMAVAKEFGDANYAKLDPLTVGLAYPDAVAAMLSGGGEITAHMASAPFCFIELDHPGIRQVLNTIDVIGPVTTIMAFTTQHFAKDNPKITAAFVASLKEATEFVAKNKPEAAQIYLKQAKVKMDEGQLMRVLNDPDLQFSLTPKGVMTYANFMSRVGLMKSKPESWKDVFVPEIGGLNGS